MDPATILSDVQLAISLGKMAVDLGEEAAPFLINAYNIAFGDKVLTADDRASMQAQEAQMRARIDAAIAADDSAAS
jgi:hypothetical protein